MTATLYATLQHTCNTPAKHLQHTCNTLQHLLPKALRPKYGEGGVTQDHVDFVDGPLAFK